MICHIQKSEAPLAGGANANETADQSAIFYGQDQDRKRFATLAARFALAGHGLIEAGPQDGSAPYYATRWGLIKPLDSLDAAEAFLRRVGGAS